MSKEIRYKCDLCLCLLGDFRPGFSSDHLGFDHTNNEDGEEIIVPTTDLPSADIHVCCDCSYTIAGQRRSTS